MAEPRREETSEGWSCQSQGNPPLCGHASRQRRHPTPTASALALHRVGPDVGLRVLRRPLPKPRHTARSRPTSSGLCSPARIGPAGETKDRRGYEADKSSEWRGRFSEHHQAD
jgi:hypothetical protein